MVANIIIGQLVKRMLKVWVMIVSYIICPENPENKPNIIIGIFCIKFLYNI